MKKNIPFNFLLAGFGFLFLSAYFESFKNEGELFALARMGMGLAFFAAFLICLQQKRFKPEHKKFVTRFIILLIYVITLTIPNLFKFYWVDGVRVSIAMEMAFYSMFAIGLVLLTLTYAEIVLLLRILLGSSVILFLFMIPRMETGQVIEVANRHAALAIVFGEEGGGIYKTQMSITHLFSSLFLIMFAVRVKIFWRLLALGGLAFVIITSFYYSKRATLLELVTAISLFILVYGTLSGRFAGIRKFQFLFFVLIGGGVLFVGSSFFGGGGDILVERLLSRFDEFSEQDFNIWNFSRIYEARMWWREAPFVNKLLGGGGIYFHRSAVTGGVSTGLHIGWAAMFVKGGPVLLFYMLSILFNNIATGLRNMKRPSALIGTTLPPYFILGMCHSTIFGPYFSGVAVILSLFLFPAIYSLENRGLAPTIFDLDLYKQNKVRERNPY